MNDYKPAIAETNQSKIYTHNRAHIALGHAFSLTCRQDENITTMGALKTLAPEQLRGIFNDLVNHEITSAPDNQGALIIFHAIDPADEINLTNSKLANLHFHVISGPLAEDSQYIQTEKTYVPHPNPDITETVRSMVEREQVSSWDILKLGTNSGGEAAIHNILVHPGFRKLSDLATNGSDADIELFRENMIELIAPFTEDGVGGTRIIIDERYNNTGMLTVHAIGGELLGHPPDPKHRWFNRPSP